MTLSAAGTSNSSQLQPLTAANASLQSLTASSFTKDATESSLQISDCRYSVAPKEFISQSTFTQTTAAQLTYHDSTLPYKASTAEQLQCDTDALLQSQINTAKCLRKYLKNCDQDINYEVFKQTARQFPALLEIKDIHVQYEIAAFISTVEQSLNELQRSTSAHGNLSLSWREEGKNLATSLIELIRNEQPVKDLLYQFNCSVKDSFYELNAAFSQKFRGYNPLKEKLNQFTLFVSILLKIQSLPDFSCRLLTHEQTTHHFLVAFLLKIKIITYTFSTDFHYSHRNQLFWLAYGLTPMVSCQQILSLTEQNLVALLAKPIDTCHTESRDYSSLSRESQAYNIWIWRIITLPNIIKAPSGLSDDSSSHNKVFNAIKFAQLKSVFFKFHNEISSNTSIIPPEPNSIFFGEELEYNIEYSDNDEFRCCQTSQHKLEHCQKNIERLLVEQEIQHTMTNLQSTFTFNIGDWKLKMFLDGNDVVEFHCTPYQLSQTFTVLVASTTKEYTTYELLDRTVFKLALNINLVLESGHKHIDVQKAFSGIPEVGLRFILLFLNARYLPVVLGRAEKIRHFKYPKTDSLENLTHAVSLLNALKVQKHKPRQTDYQAIIELTDFLQSLGLFVTKAVAINLMHLTRSSYSRDIDDSPKSTIELRMFHCPRSGTETRAINKFCHGLILQAWKDFNENTQLEVQQQSVMHYDENRSIAEIMMARTCKSLGLTFDEFVSMMRIPITEASFQEGGYSQSDN